MKKYLLLLLLPFLIGAAPTRVNNFSASTTARSSEVNEDFNNLYGYLQTGTDTLRAGAVDTITEITAALKSGSDQTLITGTEGSNTEFAVWNSDGDLVAITTMTGNTSGVKVTVPFLINVTSCAVLGTDSTGRIYCP